MKRIIAAAILSFLAVAYSRPALADDCSLRDEAEDEEVQLLPGAKLQPGGYICRDYWRVYLELECGRELVTARTGARYFHPYIQPRPAGRHLEGVKN